MEHDIATSAQTSAQAGTADERLLVQLLREQIHDKPFSELYEVTLDHRVQSVVGDVILHALAAQGLLPGNFEAVGALTPAAVPLVTAVVSAAGRHGDSVDGFIMDFVYPSIKGPSIADKSVVLLDAWLSEKSYIQTSSLVTLRNTNELSLDFGVVEQEGADVLAIASLIGGVADSGIANGTAESIAGPIDEDIHQHPVPAMLNEASATPHSPPASSIALTNPVTGETHEIPFVPVFGERELRTEPQQ